MAANKAVSKVTLDSRLQGLSLPVSQDRLVKAQATVANPNSGRDDNCAAAVGLTPNDFGYEYTQGGLASLLQGGDLLLSDVNLGKLGGGGGSSLAANHNTIR